MKRGFFMRKIVSYVLVLTILVASVLCSGFPINALTKVGSLHYKGSRYAIILNTRGYTFEQMEKYCESLGGHLATITSDGENTALYDFIKSLGYDDVFFGFTDSEVEGRWKWVTGETVSYTNWSSGEPNNERGIENYAMFYHGSSPYKWNDSDLQTGNTSITNTPFICEWDISIQARTTSSITLAWEQTSNANGYELQRYVSGSWKKVKDLTTDSYKIKNLAGGTKYRFRVRAYTNKNSKTYIYSSRSITAYTKPKKTTIKKISSTKNSITCEWMRISCKGYHIRYSKNKDLIGSKKKKILSSNINSKTIFNLKKNTKYYFQIRSYVKDNSKTFYSSWSKTKFIKTKK